MNKYQLRTALLLLSMLVLGAAAPSDVTLKLKVSGGNSPVEPGDVVTVNLLLTNLNGQEAAGYQAFLGFDDSRLEFIGGIYTAAFGLPIIDPMYTTGSTIDLAAGIDPFNNQSPVVTDSVLALLGFLVLEEAPCVSSVQFRLENPPTRVTDPMGQALDPLILDSLPAEPPTPDLNGDGVVDVSDLLILLGQWGACTPGELCGADLNCDGAVDVSDLLLLLENWG